jgi:phosphatidylglycerophosphate synthase
LRGLPIMDVPRTAKLYAVLIQDDGDVARARRALLLAQGHPADPPWTRRLLRPLTARLAGVLASAGVRPTAASLTALVFAVISAWLLTLSSGAGAGMAALTLWVTAVFASVDGDLARLSLRESEFGAALDRVVSDSARILACVGALIGLARSASAPWVHLVGATGVLFWFGVQLLRRDLGPVPPSLIRTLLHRDTVLAVVAALAVANFRWPLVILWPLFAAGELALVLQSRRTTQ